VVERVEDHRRLWRIVLVVVGVLIVLALVATR
jgi:hypothetical protein